MRFFTGMPILENLKDSNSALDALGYSRMIQSQVLFCQYAIVLTMLLLCYGLY